MAELVPVTTQMFWSSALRAPGGFESSRGLCKGDGLGEKAGRCFQKQVVCWVRVSRGNGLAGMQQELWFRACLLTALTTISKVSRSTQVSG